MLPEGSFWFLLFRDEGMAKTVKYDAFISYRHCEPDSDIATRLQKKLEGFRLPKDIAKKLGRTRLSRVFRDETEFAVSDDLTQAIDEALLNSKYLICICSPEYLKSEWCRKEIESFLRYHDRKHILLVLADGEPNEAFPPEVIYEDVYKIGSDGNPYWSKVAREPLAADCRGADAKERNSKIDKAAMRLIASILGLKFDDLQQRHRQEEYKRTRNRVLIVFGVLVVFLAVSLGFLFRIAKQNVEIARQNAEIAEQNEIISLKYADTLAQTSDNLLRDGKRTDAVYAARLALADEKTDNYSELATKALVKALGIYDLPNTFGCDNDVLLPSSVLDDLAVSSNGGYASFKDLDGVRYIVDLNTGATVMTFVENLDEDFAFDGEKGFVFRRQDYNYSYYDFATGTETDLGLTELRLDSNTEGEGYTTISGDTITLYNGSDAVWNINFITEGFSETARLELVVCFINETNECWVFVSDYDKQTSSAFAVDMTSGGSRQIQIAKKTCFCFATDGKSIVWSQSESDGFSLWIMDINSGKKSSISVGYVYGTAVMNDDVVILSEGSIRILNKDLEEVDSLDAGQFTKTYVSGDAIYLTDDDGRLTVIRNGAYKHYNTVRSDITYSWEQVIRNGKLYAAIPGDNHIYTYSFRNSDYMTVASGDYEELSFSYYSLDFIYDNPETSAFVDLVMQSGTEFQQNRIRTVAMCRNADMGVIQLIDGAVYIYDSSTGEKIKTIYSVDGQVNNFYYDTNTGYYYLSSSNVDVFDENFKNIYSINDCTLTGIDNQSGAIVIYARTEDDSATYFKVYPVTYEQLIPMTDEFLGGYEPDERVKEKYSLG